MVRALPAERPLSCFLNVNLFCKVRICFRQFVDHILWKLTAVETQRVLALFWTMEIKIHNCIHQ